MGGRDVCRRGKVVRGWWEGGTSVDVGRLGGRDVCRRGKVVRGRWEHRGTRCRRSNAEAQCGADVAVRGE